MESTSLAAEELWTEGWRQVLNLFVVQIHQSDGVILNTNMACFHFCLSVAPRFLHKAQYVELSGQGTPDGCVESRRAISIATETIKGAILPISDILQLNNFKFRT